MSEAAAKAPVQPRRPVGRPKEQRVIEQGEWLREMAKHPNRELPRYWVRVKVEETYFFVPAFKEEEWKRFCRK